MSNYTTNITSFVSLSRLGQQFGISDRISLKSILTSNIVSSAAKFTSYTNSTPPDIYFNNVNLLLHFDNDYKDYSINSSTISLNSPANIASGGAYSSSPTSLNIPGNGSVTTPTSTLFSLGSASFTFDLWIKINTGITQPVCFIGNGSTTATFGKNNWSFGTYYTGGSHYLSFTIYNISQTYTSYVSSDAITLGTWYNVAFQRNNNIFSLFLNGRNVGAFNWTGTIDGSIPSSLNIGSDGCLSTTNYMNGNIDDVRFTYGVARYNVTTSTMKLFPLDTLSLIAQQSYVGLYAVRRLLSNYTGPLITVRRNNDATGTALQDFYSDPNGNLYTLPFTISVVGGTAVTYISNGISFATWLTNNSATTGYITILYDQSGIGNNAIQNTTTLQPVINASKYIDFAAVSGSYLSLPTGTIPLNSTYTVSLQHGTITYVSGSYGILGGGSTSASSANNFKITSAGANAYLNSWISNEYGNYGTYTANNRITWVFGTQGVQASYVNTITNIPISFYVNGTVQNSSTKTTTWTPSASLDYIGKTTDSATNMNGQLYWLTLFNMALSSVDQTIIEANNISSTFISSPTGYVSSISYTSPTTNYANSVNLITYKNILNLYNPICALDANNVGIGSTIWTDSSGTGNNFNITATGRTSYNGTNCITGNISRGSDLTVYNSVNGGSTLITFALPNTSTTGFRYLYKSSTGYSPTIINTGTNNVGIYTSSVFTSSGLDISTLPTYNTNFNMIVTKSQSTLTQIKYNNISACNYTAVTSTTPNPFGINAIGYDGSSAGYFGNIGLVLMYNSILSESAINDIYTTFAPRFQYIMPPINTNLVGYYTGESWNGTRWLDYSGNNNAATTITNPSLIYTFNKSLSDSSGNKYQSLNGFKYLGGDSTTKITFPDFALNTSSTIFWVARYAGSIVNSSGTSGATGNRKCIFTNISTPPSWISGFLNGASGVCAHNFTTANITNSSDVYGNNWIIGCDQYKTGNVSLFRGNSTNLTVAQMSTGSTQPQFGINVSSSDQASDWLVASVLVYNIALTSSQINTIEFWLANKYGLTKSINIHPLDRTSVSSYSSCVGAYSFYRLSTSYSGPLFNIRRSNDNSIEDIYGDINGVLGVSINGTGQSLTSWLNGNKGYITIWYDQSGQGNHAVQTNQQMQPLIDLNNLFVDFSNQLISSPDTFYKRIKLPDGTVPSGSSPYTIIAKHYNGYGAILGSGSGTTNLNVFAINGSAYKNYWTTSDSTTYGTYALGNTVAFTYDGSTGSTSKKVYTATNAATSVSAVSGVPTVSTAMNNATVNNYIGYGDSITNNYFNGGLYYLYIFKNAIPITDINTVQSVTTTASLIIPTVVQVTTTVNIITNSTPVSYTSQTQLNIAWGAFTNNTVYVIVAWTSAQNNGTSGTPTSGSTTLTTSSQFNVTGLYAGILYNFTITPYNKYNIAGTVLSGFSQTMASPSILVAPSYITNNGVSFQSIFTVSDGCYYVKVAWVDQNTGSPIGNSDSGIITIVSLGGTSGGTACTYTTPSTLGSGHTYNITYTLYNFNQSVNNQITGDTFLVGQPYTMPNTFTTSTISVENMNPDAATYLQNSANWTNSTTSTNTITLTGYAYGNGTYIASASSALGGYSPWNLFKKLANQDWATAGTYYSGTTVLTAQTPTGATSQMTVSISGTNTTIYGEWIQIQFPYNILLNSYTYNGADSSNSGQNPRNWIIAGSLDGSTWIQLDAQTNIAAIATIFGVSPTYTITGNTIQYNYYRFIIRAVNGGGYAALSQWTLYTTNNLNEYPPAQLTTNTALLSTLYGSGSYTASASVANFGAAFQAFNKILVSYNDGGWLGGTPNLYGTNIYNGSTTTTVSGTNRRGEWLQIQLPLSIVLYSYSITCMNARDLPRTPTTWYLAASNDGTTWTQIDFQSNITFTTALQERLFTLATIPSSYTYYRLIAIYTGGGDGYICMNEFKLFTSPTSSIPNISYNKMYYTSISGGQDIALASAGPANFTVSAKLNNTGTDIVGTINSAASYATNYIATTGMNTIYFNGLTANSSYTLYFNLNSLSISYFPRSYSTNIGTFVTSSTIYPVFSSTNNTSITINITGAFTNYTISGTNAPTGIQTSTSFTISGLNNNRYTYNIVSYNSAGIIGLVNTTTYGTFYTSTISVSSSSRTTTTITINLSGTYYYYTISGTNSPSGNQTSTPIVISSLASNTTYAYSIISYNLNGQSGGTVNPSITTDYVPSVTAGTLTYSNGQLTISWTPGTYVSILVQLYTSGGTLYDNGTTFTGTTTTSYKFTTVISSNTTYFAKLTVYSATTNTVVNSANYVFSSTFSTFTFTLNAGDPNDLNTSATGPTTIGYNPMPVAGILTLANGIQSWTVPDTGNYRIIAAGATGLLLGQIQNGDANYGMGVIVSNIYSLTKGDVLNILVGKFGNGDGIVCGGGGGTFVIKNNSPLLIAGGGGGKSYLNTSANSSGNNINVTTASSTVNSVAIAGGGGASTITPGSGSSAVYAGSGVTAGGGGGYNNSYSNGGYGSDTNYVGANYLGGGTGGNGYTTGYNGGFGGGGGAIFYTTSLGHQLTLGGGGGGYTGGIGGTNRIFSNAEHPYMFGSGGGSYDDLGTNKNATLYSYNGSTYNQSTGFVIITKQ